MGFSKGAFNSKVERAVRAGCGATQFNTGVLRWRDEIKESLEDWYDWVSLDDGTTVREYTSGRPLPALHHRRRPGPGDRGQDVGRLRGRRHPYRQPGSRMGERRGQLLAAQARRHHRHAARGVRERRPGAADTVANGLFDKTPNTLTYLTELGSDWQGRAARNYRENFFKIVPPSIGNHAWLTGALMNAIQSAKAVTDIGQQSAMNLVEKACDTVKLALDAQADENTIDPQEVLIGLNTVIGIIGEIVPFVPTGVAEAKAISRLVGVLPRTTTSPATSALPPANAAEARHAAPPRPRPGRPVREHRRVGRGDPRRQLEGVGPRRDGAHLRLPTRPSTPGTGRCSPSSPTSRKATFRPVTSTTRPAPSTSEAPTRDTRPAASLI